MTGIKTASGEKLEKSEVKEVETDFHIGASLSRWETTKIADDK